jgi:hypothetical protein
MEDSRINRLESKIDHVVEKINSIDSTLSAQHESLKYHIKRTDLLEKQVKPIEAHVNRINGALRLISATGVVYALIRLLLKS